MNVLYKNLESLDVLEQIEDCQYDFIYLDVPLFTGHFKGSTIPENRDAEFKKYSDYIAKVIENTTRLLKPDGILAFLAPLHDYTNINFKIILDQFYTSFTSVTIQKKRPVGVHQYSAQNTNSTLYFCSKEDDYKFPVLKELPPKDRYNCEDQRGCYVKNTAFITNTHFYQYEWHGITPPDNNFWKYSEERMNELFDDGRIIIDGNRVYIKQYREEHLIPLPSTWDYNDKTKLKWKTPYLDSQSIDRMFAMFTCSGTHVLCPYERDGKFSWMADNAGLEWVSICPPGFPTEQELYSDIPEDNYMIINELQDHKSRTYQDQIVTSVNDIADLKAMAAKVKEIQSLVGGSSPDEAIEEIHKLIENQLSESAITKYIPESQKWLTPYWDKLESNSKHFIPMGMLLYNQFIDMPDADMAPIMIEYSRSLEEELLKKIFHGYVYDLRNRNIILKRKFPEAFENKDTNRFAVFLAQCMSRNKNHPEKWKFEMGNMNFVLRLALAEDPNDALIIDFRDYLEKIFDKRFFAQDFCSQLDRIGNIRNSCAHPNLVDSEETKVGKELVREKLLSILENYKD